MPIRDFRCRACATTFEALVRGDTAPPCPACGAGAAERLVSAPSAPGRSAGLLQGARRQAAREGHFSHYSARERSKLA